MGFLSKIVKSFKKLFKAVTTLPRKLFKEVKRFSKTKLGKFLITAAAIYFGGQALGVFGKASSVASTVPVTESAISSLGAGATAADTAAFAAQTGAASATGTAAGIGEGVGAALSGSAELESIAALNYASMTKAAESQVTKRLFARALDAAKATGEWMQENPIPTMAGGKFISSVFTPDPAEQQYELEQRRIRGSNIGGVDYGDTYGGASPLRASITADLQKSELQTRTY